LKTSVGRVGLRKVVR